MRLFTYRSFGLVISSQIECCELLPGPNTSPDVSLRFGRVPEILDNSEEYPLAQGILYQVINDQFLLKVDCIARYLVRNGNEIIVDPFPQADVDLVKLFLLGSAFGALLFQRGILPLHGSAVATHNGAALFVGPSGHGKSTLAGAFHQRGYSVISDDVCAIGNMDGLPLVLPAYPRLLLWPDAVGCLVGKETNLRPALAGQEKYQFPVDQKFASDAVPIRVVYVLNPTNSHSVTLTPLTGFDKIRTLTENTYRLQFLHGMNLGERHFRQIAEVAEHVSVARVDRPKGEFRLDELVDVLEADILD